MRIAVSGAHRTGKTSLVAELVAALPAFSTVAEPYYLLVDEGHVFAELPNVEDFELQLQRSIESVLQSERDCIFDRCPLDILAYLIAHDELQGVDIERSFPSLRAAMQKIDLIVFVPIEDPDRIAESELDYKDLRRRVDEELQGIVLDDEWGFGVAAMEVSGSLKERVECVLAYL